MCSWLIGPKSRYLFPGPHHGSLKPEMNSTKIHIDCFLEVYGVRGACVAQLVKHLTSAQVVISWFMSWSSAQGSVLTDCFGFCVSLSLCPFPTLWKLNIKKKKEVYGVKPISSTLNHVMLMKTISDTDIPKQSKIRSLSFGYTLYHIVYKVSGLLLCLYFAYENVKIDV